MLYTNRGFLIVFCLAAVGIWAFSSISSSRVQKPSWLRKAPADVLNETLGFQKVFVINLPSRSDRRDTMALAGSLTGIRFDWIDGVSGDDVPDKVLPADSLDKQISKGNKGSWRAHMNTLRTVVELNLTSALILEDDIDWDIRLKSQLQAYSVASRGFLQPLQSEPSSSLSSRSLSAKANGDSDNTFFLGSLPPTMPPATSPYGDDWDVLWLGHCGTDFPPSHSSSPGAKNRPRPLSTLASTTPRRLPPLRVAIPGDITVPAPKHLKPHPFAVADALSSAGYAPHTRVAHAAAGGTTCTQGYAVSARGARRLLWLFGLETMTTGWDLMLRDWCEGWYTGAEGGRGGKEEGKGAPVCLTVQPPLFSQHYGEGGKSDITAPGGGFLSSRKKMTTYVRLSVRMNMGRLARGDGVEELVDQWPDD